MATPRFTDSELGTWDRRVRAQAMGTWRRRTSTLGDDVLELISGAEPASGKRMLRIVKTGTDRFSASGAPHWSLIEATSLDALVDLLLGPEPSASAALPAQDAVGRRQAA